MKPAVLFDLGNTLAAYYRPEEFPPILERAIDAVVDELRLRGMLRVTHRSAIAAATQENREADDHRFMPMAERFERIFAISVVGDAALASSLCSRFLQPILAMGRVYDDTLPALIELRSAGYSTAIVSNAPWGSPPRYWRKELERLGIVPAVDAVVLCGDVGWRKPAKEIFLHAAAKLGRPCGECIFVGDDFRWDIVGSQAVGMRAVLIDRDGRHPEYSGERVGGLNEFVTRVVNA